MKNAMQNMRGNMRRQQYYHASPGYSSEIWEKITERDKWISWSNVFIKMEDRGLFSLHAFVMLNTHVHILYSTPRDEENFIMDSLHQILKHSLNEKNDVLEAPLLSEKIESYQQLLNTYRYIYRNPIEAGIVLRAEEYQYSSLFIQLGGKLPFANVVDPLNLIQHPARILNWLNDACKSQLYNGFRLRKTNPSQLLGREYLPFR